MSEKIGIAAPSFPTRLRASEKVRQFLNEQLLTQSAQAGCPLPTIKEIASYLDVSAFTVHAVVTKFAQDGRIITAPGRGLFAATSVVQPTDPVDTTQSILLVSIHEGEFMGPTMTWGKEICAAILREITNGSEQMLMRPFFVDKISKKADVTREVKQCRAAVVFPSPMSTELIEECRRQDKPVIHITAPRMDSTSQFVGLSNYSIAFRIGECWAKAGRRHIAVLLHHTLEERGECGQTLAGFQAALQKFPHMRVSYDSLELSDPKAVENCMARLFSESPQVDAIYSTASGIISEAIKWLSVRSISMPETVSLISGSGTQPEGGGLNSHTTLKLPFQKMGKEAVAMAVRALKSKGQLQPGVLLNAGIHLGSTTTDQENRLLAMI